MMYRINSILHLTMVGMIGIVALFTGEGATLSASTVFGDFAFTDRAAKFAAGVITWFTVVGFYEYVTVVGEDMYQGLKALIKK